MQKTAEMQKREKMHFQFRNSYKKSKNKKRKYFFGFFCFYIPGTFFCILNLKIPAKKDKNAKKMFQIAKINIQKSRKYYFKKTGRKTKKCKKMRPGEFHCLHNKIAGPGPANII